MQAGIGGVEFEKDEETMKRTDFKYYPGTG
jgi:hypothetical protein